MNVADDPAKAGFGPGDVAAALPEILGLPNLRVDGLMTIGALVDAAEAARPTFRSLRDLAATLRARHPALGAALSMGMSDDFEVAVEEGATIVRVGRALFGDRPPRRRAGVECPPHRGPGAISSVGQSARFTSVRSLVRAQYRPPS